MTTTETTGNATRTGDDRPDPILVEWLRDPALFADTARRLAKRNTHRLLRHTVWSPVYLAKLVKWSPRGFWRASTSLVAAISDSDTRHLQHAHAGRGESKEYVSLERVRHDRVHNRLIVAAVLTALAVIGFALVWWLVSPLVCQLAGLATVLVLGWVGRPQGKRILAAEKLVAGAPPPLSAPMVREALCKLGIAGMRDPAEIGLLFDVARTTGGYQVGLELPAGVEAAKVVEARGKLSAALRRELGTVWPTRGRRHEGHLDLFVADENVATAPQRPWKLRERGIVNIFDDVPMFTDQRGKWVDLRLAYTSGVIGGLPRTGKTFGMRQLGLVFGLDPRTKCYCYDLKGTGDFGPLSLFAHGYGVGDEDEDVAAQLRQLRELHDEMRRRIRKVRELSETDRELCPESKVTDLLASRRDLHLEPVLLLVDECQIWFEHADKKVKEEFIRLCTDLVKRGPALAIHSYFGTQRPDAASIPTAISANAVIRFCLKVIGHQPNDAVLGTGAYKSGIDATMFDYSDKGLGYLRGDGADAQIVRTVHGLDAVAAEKVALRARAVRKAQDRLTGYAAGDEAEEAQQDVSFLADCRDVCGNADTIHLADLAAGLRELRPDTYGAVNTRGVGSMLREAGIEPGVVWDAGKPREKASAQGVKREQLRQSVTDPDGDEDTKTGGEGTA